MRYWINAGFLEVDQLVPVARCAERLGYAGITMPDHLFLPERTESAYPYSSDGQITWPDDAPWPDCWVAITAMAQATERLRFGTSVYIGPLRDVVALAKAVGTCAALAPGRIMCGLGAGWMREEFEAVGQDFSSRGGRLDEMIDVLPRLWSGEFVDYSGDHIDLPTLRMRPPPGRVPILVGGNSRSALRRAAHADGWIASFTNMEELSAMLAELAAHREQREPLDVPHEVLVTATPGIARHATDLAALGVDGVVIPAVTLAPPRAGTEAHAIDEIIEGMERFAVRADLVPTPI